MKDDRYSNLLKESRNLILEQWEIEVKSRLEAARFESKKSLRDSIPEFLDDLSLALDSGICEVREDLLRFAHKHGAERANESEYSLEDALNEFNILREIIFEFLEKDSPLPKKERDIIYEAINVGLSKAGSEYTKRQLKRLKKEITQRKKSEEALKIANIKMHSITDIQPTCISIINADYRYEFINQTYEAWFKMKREDVLGKTIQEVLGEKAFLEIKPLFDKALGGEKVIYNKTVHYNSGERFVHVVYNPEIDKDGKVRGVYVSVSDRSEEKVILDSLKRSEEQFITLANSIPQLAWMADASGSIFWFNQRYYDFTGKKSEEVMGSEWQKLIHRDFREDGISKFLSTIKNGKDWEDTMPLKSATGEWKWFLGRAVAIKDFSGKVTRWFGTYTDVTEQKQLTDSLKKEQSLREKFVSTLSHDLRTPLTAAKMAAQLIARKISDNSIQGMTLRIVDNLNRADRMIQDLLDASKLRAGKGIASSLVEIDLIDTVNQTLEDLTTIHGDRFNLSSPSSLVSYLSPQGVRRILENLCSNAIKYGSPYDPVKISVKSEDDLVHLIVTNIKNPLYTPKLEMLFQPFERGPNAEVSGPKGWGIGLTIVKGMAESLGGEVSVKSENDETSFHVVLPLDIRKNKAQEKPSYH